MDIAKSLEAKDGFECHGLKYPPSYSVGSDNDTRKRAKKKGIGQSRRAQQRMSPAGPDDWLHCDYSVDNIVLSGDSMCSMHYPQTWSRVENPSAEIDIWCRKCYHRYCSVNFEELWTRDRSPL